MCSVHLKAISCQRAVVVPTLTIRRTSIRTLLPLHRFEQSLTWSQHYLVSQRKTLLKSNFPCKNVDRSRNTPIVTYCPAYVNLVTVLTSKVFVYRGAFGK